jgi:hypothetical protein
MSNKHFESGRGLFTIAALSVALAILCACGTSTPDSGFGQISGVGSSSGSSARPGGGSGGGTGSGGGNGTGNGPFVIADASRPAQTNAADATAPIAMVPAMGVATAADCKGCTFPPLSAPACAASIPAIKVVYPNDTALVPPNLNVISVQWTPFGPPFSFFEVDFSQSKSPVTDWRIITSCMAQTTDMQTTPATPSGGCELVVDPTSWGKIVGANRGLSNPISITVRGTTDGMCASTSSNTIHMSIAEEDLPGTYYYWKSTITSGQGVGGFIWAKAFGDLVNPEVNVTPNPKPLNATCNGCHSLSRDGSRMVVYSDDNDSDDEYGDVGGSELDMTPLPAGVATEFAGGITQGGGGGGGQPPGFTAINPQATTYVTSNGTGCTTVAAAGGGGRGGGGCAGGYTTAVPVNGWSVWSATSGAFVNGVAVGPTGTRPTMPDWSIDGTTLVYVQPQGEFTTWRQDDAHIFGGSLYTVPYTGNGTFGTPQAILTSAGENNYYPSYSPDQPMSFIIFNRVASMGAAAMCTGGFCPDDSFSNPAARLWLMQAPSAGNPTPTAIDLQKANGSTDPWSNSYPRWAPFVQTYQGQKILWFTFSSTRDYGLRILNHKTGMYQCYPADAAETPGAAHRSTFATACQMPQLWMAPIAFSGAQGTTMDPSGVAFWVPYQDITSHNHTAQWTQQAPQPPACTCGMLNGACGPANGGCPCCSGHSLVCTATGTCIQVPN